MTVVGLERWLDKRGLAEHLACSVRWIERRISDGMPHTHIAGRAKFKASEVEPWLEAHGFIDRRGEAP
jgi:hypothetical protein